MSVYDYTFWILFTQYIDIIKLVDCKSIIITKKFLMRDDEDSLSTFVLNPGRQLLGSRGYNFEPSTHNIYTSSRDSDKTGIIYVVIAIVVFIVYVLVRGCIYLVNQGDESNTESNITSNARRILHLPPRRLNSQGLVHQTRPSVSRSLAPPRTRPSTLILLPEERHLQTVFENTENSVLVGIENPVLVGIENPALVGVENQIYSISTFDNHYRENSNSTHLLDLPPNYDTVIRERSAKEEVNIAKDKDPPPQYNNI